jgi:hypothetical protein
METDFFTASLTAGEKKGVLPKSSVNDLKEAASIPFIQFLTMG